MAPENILGNSSRARVVLAALLTAAVCMPWFPGIVASGTAEVWAEQPAGRWGSNKGLPVPLQFGGWGPVPQTMPVADFDDESEDGLNNDINLNVSDIDSEELAGYLRAGVRFHERRDWGNALKAYYMVINAPQDYLYKQSGLDEDRVYIGMKEFCRRRLESFPEEGRHIFKVRYDRTVRKMFEKACRELDLNTLRLIQFNYALSSYGDDAVSLAADILYEEGNLNEAIYYYDRLIRKHPDTDRPLELAYARLAMCALRIGPSTLPLLREHGGTLTGALGNRRIIAFDDDGRRLETSLRQFMADVRAKLQKMKQKIGDPGASSIDPGMFRNLELKWKITESRKHVGAWNAALFGDRLFLDPVGSPQGIKVFDIRTDIRTGKIVNVLGQRVSRNVTFTSQNIPADELFPSTVSRDGMNYYAIMPQNLRTARGMSSVNVERWTTRLQAFDRRHNKIVWWWEPGQYSRKGNVVETSHNEAAPASSAEDRDFMGQAYLTSAPVRYGAYLYTGAIRITFMGSYEFFVVCFDPTTGGLKWRTYIGSLNSTTALWTRRHGQTAAPIVGSRVHVANDTVFFSSNMGVVGAINSVTGDVKWVTKYHRPALRMMRGNVITCGPPFMWHESPPIFLHNVRRKGRGDTEKTVSILIVAPRDSDHLYAFDPETGKRFWDRPLFAPGYPVSPLEPPRTFAILGDKIVIFQSALSMQTQPNIRYAMPMPGMPPVAEPARKDGDATLRGKKVFAVNTTTGKLDSFGAYLGDNETLVGRPIVTGSMIFLLIKHQEQDRAVYAVIGYDTGKSDAKIVVYRDVSELCDKMAIKRMFVTRDRVIFVCNGVVYAYGPPERKPPGEVSQRKACQPPRLARPTSWGLFLSRSLSSDTVPEDTERGKYKSGLWPPPRLAGSPSATSFLLRFLIPGIARNNQNAK